METTKLKDLSFEALCSIIAKVTHSANRAYVDAIGGRAVNLTWEEIRDEERQGLIRAVANMITNPQTPAVSHEKWCLAREKDGWSKDLKYDYHRKTHPNMIPYDQLPIEEQLKDQLFMGLASIFCAGLGILDMPEVQAARRILAAQYTPIDDPNEAIKAKLKETQEKLDKLQAERDGESKETPDVVIKETPDVVIKETPDVVEPIKSKPKKKAIAKK